MPTYEHECSKCEYIWEDIYSIHDSVPTVCPNCKSEGTVKRIISRPGTGQVILTGKELVAQLRKEGKELAKKARKDENLAANLYGTNK